MEKSDDKREVEAKRVFVQPSDAPAFYSDLTQVVATKREIVLQFYQNIPGPPTSEGDIVEITSRLQATIALNLTHAKKLGKLLLERAN